MKDLLLPYSRRVWTSLEKVIANGHPRETVFADWISLMLDAYLSLTENLARKGTNDPEDLDGPYEERYAATAAKYRHQDLLALVQAYLDLAIGVAMHGGDVLGELYSKCITNRRKTYLTPHELRNKVELLALRPGMHVQSRRCGSGTLLIEAGKIADVDLRGEDSDPVCARMCALNLVLFGFRGVVREGDTDKCVREWRIAKGHVSEHGRGDEEARNQGAGSLERPRPSRRRGSDSSRPRKAGLCGKQVAGDEAVAPLLRGGRRELAHHAARR
jgi:hypothetical protein